MAEVDEVCLNEQFRAMKLALSELENKLAISEQRHRHLSELAFSEQRRLSELAFLEQRHLSDLIEADRTRGK